MSEAQLQAEIVMWYTNNYCLKIHNPKGVIFSVPNELSGTNVIATMQAKAKGLKKGVSDLVVILPNKQTIFVELKVGKNTQSESQKAFQRDVQALGFNYHLVYSLNEFKQIICKYLEK
jgi:hypothetical protein